MEWYQKFKESKITDLIYRFCLWFFIGCFLNFLASKSDGVSGAYIAKAIEKLPSINYGQTIGVFGLIVAIVPIALKDIQLNINGNSKIYFACKETSSFFGKISSDLLLVTYGIMSFILGGTYYYYFQGIFQDDQSLELLLLTPFYLFILFLIALISLVVRASKYSQLLSWWMVVPSFVRGGSYLMLIILMPLFIWHHK